MDKKTLIGVAALGVVGFIAYSMRQGAQQQVNSTAANTSGSASAVLSGLLSGWANPSSVVPSAATVAANGMLATPAPAPAPTSPGDFAVGGQGIRVSTRVNTPAPSPAPAPAPVAVPMPAAPAPALAFESSVKDALQSLLGGYKVTDADAHYWTNHGGVEAVNTTFGKTTIPTWQDFDKA